MRLLGQQIRRRRQEQGLTQQQAAEGICSVSLLSMIESGRARPSARTLHKLAERLALSLADLVRQAPQALEHVTRFRLGVVLLEAGDWQTAADLFHSIPETARVEIGQFAWYYAQARCAFLGGATEYAIEQLEAACERAVLLQDRQQMVESVCQLGELAEARGLWQVAAHEYRRAYRLLQRCSWVDTARELRLCQALWRTEDQLGRRDEAADWLERVKGLEQTAGRLEEQANQYSFQALACLQQGEYATALAFIQTAEQRQAERRAKREQCEGKRLYAKHLVGEGEYEQACSWYRSALSEVLADGDITLIGQLQGEMAVCLLRTGRRQAAWEVWEQLVQVIPPHDLFCQKPS